MSIPFDHPDYEPITPNIDAANILLLIRTYNLRSNRNSDYQFLL
jgi:hypothetical protein